MRAAIGAITAASKVGRKVLPRSDQLAWAPRLTHSPSGSIAAVASVATTVRPVGAGIMRGNTMIHTATGVQPREPIAGAIAAEWKSTATKNPSTTS